MVGYQVRNSAGKKEINMHNPKCPCDDCSDETNKIKEKEEFNSEQITNKLAEIRKLQQECKDLADEAGLDFTYPSPGWGMGGHYYSLKAWNKDWEGDAPDWEYETDNGWRSSSRTC